MALIRDRLLSCAVDREEHCKQTPLTCGERVQGMDHSGVATPTVACTTQIQAAQAPRCTAGHSSRWAVSLLKGAGLRPLHSCQNSPGSQEDVVSDWGPTHSSVGDAFSGAEIAVAPCLLPLAIVHLLPAPGEGVMKEKFPHNSKLCHRGSQWATLESQRTT